jgi:hypothetical protein
MLGSLAKQLDYRQTYDTYEKLNAATRANLSFDTFSKLKQVEKVIIETGQERVGVLLNELFEIEKAMNANGAAQKKNRMVGLASSLFGSFLLMVANLVAARNGA